MAENKIPEVHFILKENSTDEGETILSISYPLMHWED